MKQKALIYCRVSSARQKKEGHGLDSQEHRCRIYAEQNDYEVAEVFHDDFTGGGDFMNRPAMRRLISFLDRYSGDDFVIIFDDLKRLARDIEFHWKLRKTLRQRNAIPKCLNFNFEESPEGQFVETVLAGAGELERKQNQRQVYEKMKARLEKGYWPFYPPIGYTYAVDKQHGKMLVPKQPDAQYVKIALENYANGVFQTKAEARKFLCEKLNRSLGHLFADRMFARIIYAGYIEYLPWSVVRRQGYHIPLISLDTYERIQERLIGKRHNYERKDNRKEFPLRGFVKCDSCNRRLTASWTTGQTGQKYPYYRCLTPKCLGSISKQDLEQEFKKLLGRLKPVPNVFSLLEEVVRLEHEDKERNKTQRIAQLQKKVSELEGRKESLLMYAVEASNNTVRKAYEEQVEKVELDLRSVRSELSNCQIPKKVGNLSFRGRDLLENPLKAWENGSLEVRQTLQNLIFPKALSYAKNGGFGNTKNGFVYAVLSPFRVSKSQLVEIVEKYWKEVCELCQV